MAVVHSTAMTSWILLTLCFPIAIAVPHIPQVVFPSKDYTGISRGKTSIKNAGSTTDLNGRIVLAPIEGKQIYTMDRYLITSSERVEPKAPLPRTTQSAAKTAGIPAISQRGISAINEVVVAENLTRTTMAEGQVHEKTMNLTTTTVGPTTSELPPKNKNPLSTLRNVRLVSHDTSHSSSEIRYPAQDWQLPPQLLSARTKSKALDTNTIKAAETKSVEEASYEEALDLYMKSQQNNAPAKLHANPPSLQHVVKSIDAMIEKAFGEKKSKPKMTVRSDNKKFRATFRSHRGDKQAIPLPDETDMDLLVENTRRPSGPSTYQKAATVLERPVGLQKTPVALPDAPSTYVSVDPNYKLDLCCRKQQVTAVCQNMCNFDTFTDRSLVNAVLSNQCPGPQLGQAFDCASSKADHTDCCTRNNLHLYAGGQCMPFCRTHQPTPPNLISYLACLQVFDTIKNCYREYSYSHPNIYGD
ncbi:DB domain-containing protein [Aphelenchoides besseyi]|nr:DB domain-containing protein [Aphelenchoides besseyi]